MEKISTLYFIKQYTANTTTMKNRQICLNVLYLFCASSACHIYIHTHNLWAIFKDFFEKVLSLLISLSRSSLIMVSSHIPTHIEKEWWEIVRIESWFTEIIHITAYLYHRWL